VSTRSVEAEIGLCLLLSAVDGEISEAEVGALSTRVGQLLGDDFDPMRLPAMLDGELEKIAALGVDDYIKALPARIGPTRRRIALEAALKVARADGLAPEEEEVFRQVAEVLELDAEDLNPT